MSNIIIPIFIHSIDIKGDKITIFVREKGKFIGFDENGLMVLREGSVKRITIKTEGKPLQISEEQCAIIPAQEEKILFSNNDNTTNFMKNNFSIN